MGDPDVQDPPVKAKAQGHAPAPEEGHHVVVPALVNAGNKEDLLVPEEARPAPAKAARAAPRANADEGESANANSRLARHLHRVCSLVRIQTR